ncbi:ABC transporter family substrate-binding protein [Corynebacterium felinum]|uniref:Solute-binding protein family 5 domain-containing protein n=1 Tax=Corynebacterium felinum TaxID=131318 RepID=A0ABU2B9B9_9CORY|nr:ABC transporter family substrate-binding protein [Corynebacterium felinum]MDF5821257.1 ABC transporter family substrate-binding protein [Corynebacterium felinum]MDR7355224.1 hypothetical protein [Corynebacterium felinum]WJY94575.1 putative monoacyl phosphatidylinositol tetramannoside-binding protein LpqW precursor [Corynebacterium felinum]
MRKKRVGVVVSLALFCAAGCSAAPGPAPVEDPLAQQVKNSTTSTAPAQPKKQAKELAIGIDQIQNGFNPHLLVDDSRFTQTLASLVLPSAFVAGKLNDDLLLKAERLAPDVEKQKDVVFTIRYDIAPEAQWSDGTPITVADFEYLWASMRNSAGTLNPSGYRAISAIRSAGAGKTVFVDFQKEYADWQGLFQSLLPAHLLRGEAFSKVLAQGIPAAAGKFLVRSIDRQRGVITLHRNDRWWGKEPARVETLTFREIRSTVQGVEMLETGQVSFLDVSPTQTSREAYDLIPDTQVRIEPDAYTLEVVANTHLDPLLRRELRSLIDAGLLSRLAFGRDVDIDVARRNPEPSFENLRLYSLSRPVIIGVDPAREVDFNAAKTLSYQLAKYNIVTQLVQADMNELMRSQIPHGDVDVVVATNGALLAERYACPATGVLGSNQSGFCDPDLQKSIDEYFAGTVGADELATLIGQLEEEQALRTVVARDKRLEVLGHGIVGPEPKLEDWPKGLSSLHTWRIHE